MSCGGPIKGIFCAITFACLRAAINANAAGTINSTNAYAWGENIGFLDFRPSAADGVVIGEFICSGWIWCANVGWINMGDGAPANHIQYSNRSATDYGVNSGIDTTQPGYATLRGYAYGANIGWINFEATGNPRVRFTDGRLLGYAYCANCGWLNLGEIGGTVYVQTDTIAMGVDSDGDGISDAWELGEAGDLTTLTATGDADGDGESDLAEYFADTDPFDPNDQLRIVAFTVVPDLTRYTLTWTSQPTRHYRIEENPDLVSPWTLTLDDVPADTTTTERTLTLAGGPQRFFRVQAFRPLAP